MTTFRKIFSIFTREELRFSVVLLFLMVIGALLEAVGIGAIYPFINLIGDSSWLEHHSAIQKWITNLGITDNTSFILFSSGILIILYIIKNLFIAWENKVQLNFALKGQCHYSEQLFALYLNKPYLYHTSINSAELLRNVSSGGDCIFLGILVSFLTLFTEIFTILVIWAMLFKIDWITALLVIIILGPMIWAIYFFFKKKVAQKGKIQAHNTSLCNKWIHQGLGAIKETKVLQKESFFCDAFRKAYFERAKANTEFRFITVLPQLALEMVSVCGLLLIVIIKIQLGSNSATIVASLGVLAIAIVRLMPAANRIINNINIIRFQVPFFNDLYKDLLYIKKNGDQTEALKKNSDTHKLNFEKSIDVKHLSFQYPNSSEFIFKDVNFSITKGSFVGIIGPSGAGKTTFVDVLLGLLPPTSGTLCVDGTDLQTHTAAWLKNLAYVPQNIYLIDGSIAENIALGVAKEDIDENRIQQVLKQAELYDFIDTKTKGIHTQVGERGIRLSGGQKQRIGISRALYNKPEILILDEATSALDTQTEKNITQTILKLKGEITIISIAHRESTLEAADFKIRFNNGHASRVSEPS